MDGHYEGGSASSAISVAPANVRLVKPANVRLAKVCGSLECS